MNEDLPYRHSEFSALPVTVAATALLPLAIGVVTEVSPPVLLPAALFVSVAILATHSVSVHVDRQEFIVRLGNGMLRQCIALASVESVDWGEGERVWGLGTTRRGIRSFGTGARRHLRIVHSRGVTIVGIQHAESVAGELRERLQASERSGKDEA